MKSSVAGDNRGFVLIAALFVLLFVSGISLRTAVRAQADRAAISNVVSAARARAAARASLAEALLELRRLQAQTAEAPPGDGHWLDRWNLLGVGDEYGEEIRLAGDGVWRVSRIRDLGSRLPIARVTERELERLLLQLGCSEADARSHAARILHVRDADDLPASVEQLMRMPELESLPVTFRDHLTFDGEQRVNVNTASAVVLMSLPGITPEAAALLLDGRRDGTAVRSLPELVDRLSPPARAVLLAEYSAFSAMASVEPRHLEIISRAGVEGGRVTAEIRSVVVRAGTTVQVLSSIDR